MDQVHRVGRSGRAGAPGRSLSLVWPGDTAFCGQLARHMQNSWKEYPGWLETGPPAPAEAVEYTRELKERWLAETSAGAPRTH